MTYQITRADIARQIARMGTAKVAAAARAAGLAPMDHTSNVGALTDRVIQGTLNLNQIGGVPVVAPAATVSTPPGTVTTSAPAAPMPDPRVDAASSAAARAEALALENATSLSALKGIVSSAVRTISTIEGSIATLGEDVRKATQVDKSAAQAVLRTVVEEAFGPIRAAVEARTLSVEEVKTAIGAGPVSRVTVAEAFGVAVSDMKGNPLMVDIWDDPEAPAVDPLFIWTEPVLRRLVAAVETGANLWMGGEKGTGKTETAKQFAARTGRRFNRVNFHKFTTAESFIGATSLTNGNTQFELGEFTGVFCTVPGSLSLLDEPSNADPGEMAQLNALLEPNGRVNLGGIDRTRAPGALVFAADNTMGTGDMTGLYVGVRQQNAALLDRFGLKVAFSFLPLDQEVAAVVGHTGAREAGVREVMKVVTAARAKVQTGEVVNAPSIRQVIAWIRAMPYLGVRAAWTHSIAASQPSEGAAAIEALYIAEVNESKIEGLI